MRGMLYPHSLCTATGDRIGTDEDGLSLRRRGVVVALVSDLYFLLLDPADTPGWVLAVIAQYRTRLALALFLFLAILAALRVRPTRLDPGVPYRSLLLRDGALAATVVAVMVGIDALPDDRAAGDGVSPTTCARYAAEAAPKIVSYVNEVRDGDPREARTRRAPPPRRSGTFRRPRGRLGGRGDPAAARRSGTSAARWPTSSCAPSSSERLAGWSGCSADAPARRETRSPAGPPAGNEIGARGTGRGGPAPRRRAR